MGIAAPESPSWYLEEILHYYTSVPAWFPLETVGSTYDSHFRSLQPFSPGSVSNWTVGPLLLDNQILPSGPIPVELKRCSVHPVPNTYQERHRLPNKKQSTTDNSETLLLNLGKKGRRELNVYKIIHPPPRKKKKELKPANVTKLRELLLNTIRTHSLHLWFLPEGPSQFLELSSRHVSCPPQHICHLASTPTWRERKQVGAG